MTAVRRHPERDIFTPMTVGALSLAGFRCETNKHIIPLHASDDWLMPTGERIRHYRFADLIATRCGCTPQLIVEVKAHHYPCKASTAISQVIGYGQCEIAHQQRRINDPVPRLLHRCVAHLTRLPDRLIPPVLAIAMPITHRHRAHIAAMCAAAGVHLIDLAATPVTIPDALIAAMEAPARLVHPAAPILEVSHV